MGQLPESQKRLCGVHIGQDGVVHLAVDAGPGQPRREETLADFRPFVWRKGAPEPPAEPGGESLALAGQAPFDHVLFFNTLDAYRGYLKEHGRGGQVELLRPLESQFLLQARERMFAGMTFPEARRCQLDIETGCEVPGGFSNAEREGDRVLAIGLRIDETDTFLELEEHTDAAEKTLLAKFNAWLARHDPDIIEGHNLYKFDLDYLRRRARRLKMPLKWGRFGERPSFRNSRLRVAERWLDFPRCDIPGRTVFDTWMAIQLFDVTTRDLPSYRLKDVARYLAVTREDDSNARTYLDGEDIGKVFDDDRGRFRAYLSDDLRETGGIAASLLPTYIAQAQNFPMPLQEICLRGTGSKVDSLFLEKYFHAGHSLPEPAEVGAYEGGYTRSFQTGVFKNVLHFDVASLYPSLLMLIGRNPEADTLGIFIPLLKDLRAYRLDYKRRAREETDPQLRQEYAARQASYKILINSFYGYLGFRGARFADGELAAEVTRRGRELLQELVTEFERLGCTVLEADTDGLYLASEAYWEEPERLLEKVRPVLPEGIDLEFDGFYPAMFCYKAKNYALYDGEKILVRGSALRSRGTEPFLKELTNLLIAHQLGLSETSPIERIGEMREAIQTATMPVEKLARSEYLSQNPESYAKAIEGSRKPRRASLEVALKSERPLRMGDQVKYYIAPGEKKREPDWQRARALESFDPENAPYDPGYYLRKLDDWLKRYGEFVEGSSIPWQKELL